ncbi:MAG: phenylalanine--tRNA ligase subunit beta [Elusimicrobia bacterium]|nr:phenylalanine--tRNA ligase subunit beta [Elusimicrobiota bacterium]
MRYLLSWLEEFLPQPLPSFDKTVEALEQIGLSVENVKNNPITFKGVVLGEVKEVSGHPHADRLRLALVSDGSKEYKVVCGAPNLAAGQKIAFAPVGAKLKAGQAQETVIEPRKIRNIPSEGMICSQLELDLGVEHDGILVLPDDWSLGRSLEDYVRPETVIDIELPSHRWDLTSHLGLARELAVYFWRSGIKFPFVIPAEAGIQIPTLLINVHDDAAWACRRYEGLLISGIRVVKSPWWMIRRLEAMGQKSINNIADTTNYVTFELGQPMHAFDWSKIRGQKIEVRWAKNGEKLIALNDKEYELTPADLVIADSERPVALAGIIGGRETSTSETTADIFLECAWFSRKPVRETARRLIVATESSARFEKETDIMSLDSAMKRAVYLIKQTGGQVKAATSVFPQKPASCQIVFSPQKIEKILGFSVSRDELSATLDPLAEELKKTEPERWVMTPKTWRNDLRLPEDIAEEIMRFKGFDNVPGRSHYAARIPVKSERPKEVDNDQERLLAYRFTEIFRHNGFHGAVNFPLVSAAEIETLCGSSQLINSIELANPVSTELAWLRPTLFIGLYKNWLSNKKNSQRQLFLQEIGYVHRLASSKTLSPCGRGQGEGTMGCDDASVRPWNSALHWSAIAFGPAEAVHWTRQKPPGFGFWDMLGFLEISLADLKMPVKRRPCDVLWPCFHPDSSLELWIKDVLAGHIAQIVTKDSLDPRLGSPLVWAELNLNIIASLAQTKERTRFKPLAVFDQIQRDIALVIDKEVHWADIERCAREVLGDLIVELYPFDVHESQKLGPQKKGIALRLTLQPRKKTPTQEEITEWTEAVIARLEKDLKVKLRE